jgi:protein-S-isoprenylcysteine O-methyltransferase Ste14
MSAEAVVVLRWVLLIALAFELGVRAWYFHRRWKALHACPGGTKSSTPDVVWLVAGGGAHYVSIAIFIVFPGWVAFAQLPFVYVPVVTGCLLLCAGLALLVWSHRALGVAFRVSACPTDGHPLVIGGPYRWVRHPIYLSLLLKAVGVALATSNLLVAGVCAALLVGVFIRIPHEERLLRAAYGGVWDEHVQRTGALFPRIAREDAGSSKSR